MPVPTLLNWIDLRYRQSVNGSSRKVARLIDHRETRFALGVLFAHQQAEETGMQQAHMSALETKHAGLDARIAEENQRPHPDETLLSRLKKEKLRIKEALTGL
jgi:hypothetical protein